ncbi:MAG TPA: phosphatidate cytidylyltransferase, partial [Alphaproteobacteria bacterium]|nr:phosphatidate cytidylyltransferase [Alphaproteobacteria bacterium]
VVWAADIMAYLVGTWLGGPKLWPKASPNKTWTGFVAGVAAGFGAGAGFAAATGADPLPLAILAGLLAVASVGGDLAMSMFKRRFGVKDTGQIIPG